jgi:hypothetical protein
MAGRSGGSHEGGGPGRRAPRGAARRVSRATFGLIVGALIAAAMPSAAGAEVLGKFKVKGGHFEQHLNYTANYNLTGVGATEGDCYVFEYHDRGAADYVLSFERGKVSRWKLKDELFVNTGSEDLGITGGISRVFNSTVDTRQGPGFDEDCDPADPPTDPAQGCGQVNVNDVDTDLTLIAARRGSPAPDGGHAMLWGAILGLDGLYLNCPSTSVYGTIALDSVSKQGVNQLDKAKPGETLKLGADRRATFTDRTGFIWPFGDWVSGEQTVSVDWALKVKRVK